MERGSSFESKLHVFRTMDRMSSELQKVRESEEQLRADRRTMMERLRDARRLVSQDSTTDARLLDLVVDMQYLVAENGDAKTGVEAYPTLLSHRIAQPPSECAKQPDSLPSYQLDEDRIDIDDDEKELVTPEEDTNPQIRITVFGDHFPTDVTSDQHLEENVGSLAHSENTRAHACLKCSNAMTWSSFDEGSYSAGWVCEHVLACGSRWSNVGASRWFCKSCHVDICGKCEDQCFASDTAANQNKLETCGEVNCYDHHGSRCEKCSTKFTFMNRRHHCRSCGACVCHSCSPYKVFLENPIVGPGEGKRAGARRVCQHCYASGSAVIKGNTCGV